MTIKAFGFINPINTENQERNWRTFDTNSKFGIWEPTWNNFTNIGTVVAYYQLYGPLTYYYIKAEQSGGGLITTGAFTGTISNIPYGPEAPSSLKTSFRNNQYLEVLKEGDQELNPGYKARMRAVGSITDIVMPGPIVGVEELYIYGWIFRDA